MNEWKELVTQSLDEYAQGIDAASLSRLKQARVKALQQAAEQDCPAQRWRWLFGGAVTAALSAMVLVVLVGIQPPHWQVEDPDIVILGNDMELLEDLDFYLWLQNADAGTGES